ncbi:MAG: class I SAM-dependent methyltransferase [Microbacterium sp.]|nr:class I SAM-dependent methyltransferase [Microbacterium sp.]
MRHAYVAFMRGARTVCRGLGLLGFAERRMATSRGARWFRSLFAIYDLEDLARLDLPWWTFDAIDRVGAFLGERPGARVFEWGSGSSTVWLSRRAGSVHSIEHDAEWAEHLRVFLATPEISAQNVRLETVEPVQTSGTPVVGSRKSGFAGLDFTAYVDAIDAVDGVFDVIVVDGRAREACFVRALDRLAPGGIIVFDNVQRARYREAVAAAGDRVDAVWTRGLTACLPYSDQTALISRAG